MTVAPLTASDTEAHAARVALSRAILRLPEEQRLVLTLFHFERLPLEEVALVLDTSEDEVAALLYLAYVGVGMIGADELVPRPALQVA